MKNEFPTEQDLLRGAIRHDLDSLGMIYDRFNRGIFGYAMRLLGDEEMAEECVAETFSRFLKALRAGAGPKEFLKAYLYRIAHNWITDSYRRQVCELVELDETIRGDENELPERQTEAYLAGQQIRMALRGLTPDQRQVIVLRYIEGWENEEVAASLGKNIGAVKALQHRALDSMNKMLTKKEMESENRSAQRI